MVDLTSKDLLTGLRFVLGAAFICLGLARFFGGEKFEAWVKAKLEDSWIRLAYLAIPSLGLAEAKTARWIFYKYFGRNVSLRRFSVALFLSFFFPTVSAFRVWDHYLMVLLMAELRWEAFLSRDVWIHFCVIYVSLWVSCLLIEGSIEWCAKRRNSNAIFIMLVVVNALAATFISDQAMKIFDFSVGNSNLPPEMMGIVGRDHVTVDFTDYMYYGVMLNSYYYMSTFLWVLRLGFFAGFITWVVSGWSLTILKVTIYRLLEAEKGPVSIVLMALGFAVGGLK